MADGAVTGAGEFPAGEDREEAAEEVVDGAVGGVGVVGFAVETGPGAQ